MPDSKSVYSIGDHKYQNELKIALTSKNRSTHKSLKWVLILAQCFGQFPVQGITEPDPRSLKFTWKSWRVLYCVLNIMGVALLAIFYSYFFMAKGTNFFQSSSMAFHANTLLLTVLFLKLARDWPQLMYKWSSVEYSMRSYGWPHHLHTRITIMSAILLSFALVENLLAKASSLYKSYHCKQKDESVADYFFRVHLYPEVMNAFGYSLWKAVLLETESILITFVWTFNDLFIMLISTALALRFKQITARLRLLKQNSKTKNISVWRDIREDYNRIVQLTRHVDGSLSYTILTSFAGNLFFILLQLFHSLREFNSIIEKVYFFFSFALLILRTICVSIYGAWIYDESKEPLVILNSICSEAYNIEIRRFIEQVKCDTVALTGKDFFSITRGLILSMAGAIVTYELVLVQFNQNLLKESAMNARNSTNVC